MVRFGAMGDMVLMICMIRVLSARYGAPVDILSSGPWTRPLLEGQPGVGRIHLLKNRSPLFMLGSEQRALVRALRERGPGPTWYCDTNGKCLHLLRRAGIGPDLITQASDLPMRIGEHLVEYWHRLARRSPVAGRPPITDDVPDQDPELVVSASEAENLDRWLAGRGLAGRRLFLVQPGNKRTMRRGLRRRPSNTKWWPEARWAAVIRAMAEQDPQAAILMLGVPQEHGLNQQIIGLAGVEGVLNVADDLPIPRLLALQARASAMVSVDTGPAHSAAALGCPVLVLFGIADPARNRPRGSAAVRHLVGQDDGARSMLGITAEQVVAEWRELPKR